MSSKADDHGYSIRTPNQLRVYSSNWCEHAHERRTRCFGRAIRGVRGEVNPRDDDFFTFFANTGKMQD